MLQKVDVVETLRIEKQKLRTFKVTFHFLPPQRYCDDKLLSPQQILHYMETRCVSVRVVNDAEPRVVSVFTLCWFVRPPRFFRLLLEAIKKRSAKLASIAVEARKATRTDKDYDGDGTAGVCCFSLYFNAVTHLLNVRFYLNFFFCVALTFLSQTTGTERRTGRSWTTRGTKETPTRQTPSGKTNRKRRYQDG